MKLDSLETAVVRLFEVGVRAHLDVDGVGREWSPRPRLSQQIARALTKVFVTILVAVIAVTVRRLALVLVEVEVSPDRCIQVLGE